MKHILVLAVTLILFGCNASQSTEPAKAADPQADKAAIDQVRDAFIAAFNAGDTAKIGSLYAENSVAMGGNGPTAEGRAAIEANNKALFDQFTAKITINPMVTKASGDLGYDQGTYTMELTPKTGGGKPMTEEGRYLVVLQREADAWRLVADMDNRIPPPPPPAPGNKK